MADRKPPINAGKYRHQIVLARSSDDSSRDSFGERQGEGPQEFRVWAAREDWGGREIDELGREIAIMTVRFRVRWQEGIDSTMIVYHGQDKYEIENALDFDGTRRELVLNCRRVQ